jgi:hypothetical protein
MGEQVIPSGTLGAIERLGQHIGGEIQCRT